MRRPLGPAATAAFATLLALQPVRAQSPEPEHPVMGHTLYFGTGFIMTPSPFVPQTSGFVTTSILVSEDLGNPAFPTTHSRVAGGVTLAQWIEVGGMASSRDNFAAFGKVQVFRQSDIFPAIAFGVMNATTADMGRFGLFDRFYADASDAISVFGVASYVVGPGGRDFPSWVVLSAGWGSGVFEKDNPAFRGSDGTGGAFGAVAFDFQAAKNAFIRVITEWDGFDLNMGVTAWLAGLEFSAGVLSVDEGKAERPAPGDPTRTPQGLFYNQAKPYFSVTVDARALEHLPWVWRGKGEEK